MADDKKKGASAPKEESQPSNIETRETLEDKQSDHEGYVEAEAPKEDNKVRAVASPEDSLYKGAMQGAPDTGYVGLLENYVEGDVDPMADSMRQQAENYPRVSAEVFLPEEQEKEQARQGHTATSRADIGRVVVVDADCIVGGEVVKAGVQDLPLEIADSLISEGLAFEPAGKKRGR
jgi:hypothetical protein